MAPSLRAETIHLKDGGFNLNVDIKMNILGKRLLGKKVYAINSGLDNWGFSFTDGSGMVVNTKMEIILLSKQNEMFVTDVKINNEMVEIVLGKYSFIRIILDDNFLIGPEFFIFQDVDGTTIIEN